LGKLKTKDKIKMYNLYTISKKKSNIVGFWQDDKKIYRDNIVIKSFSSYRKFQLGIKKLFLQGEKAVFYEKLNIGYIENNNGMIEKLPYKIELREKTLKAGYIKALLFQHNGLTIFKNKNGYLIELWKE
jgi:hypothetical protein